MCDGKSVASMDTGLRGFFMGALGAGSGQAGGTGGDLQLLLLLMILFPGLFSGENSLLMFILIIMLATGGRV